ncbi:MAG: YbaK/EbsC family protein [archaeon]|nr:YbaK/EbsC family protein [archaeon]
MGKAEFEKMVSFLREKNARFELLEHEPVFTSADAARVRGVQASMGVKAIVMKTASGGFVLACVPGDKKVNTKKLSNILGEKRVFLASPPEVLDLTGCEIGSVSPLCAIFGIKTLFDKSVFENEFVEFNVGLHTHSVRMPSSELKRVIAPQVQGFAK